MKYLRIKKNTDFQKMFQRGKKVFSPNITLLYLYSDKLSMGVAVSKKHGKAVKRNRIKRLLRAVFSENCGLLERPLSVILIPRVADEYSYESFEKSIKICFKKVNLCRENSKNS